MPNVYIEPRSKGRPEGAPASTALAQMFPARLRIAGPATAQ
jgi:hypothetical protein